MKKHFIYLFLITSMCSCGWFASDKDSDNLNILIKSKQAGDYKIGDDIDKIELTNNQTFSSVEVPVGEGETEVRWFLKDNNLELLKFSEGKGKNNTKIIREIEVLSPLYQTKQRIGIGSNLDKLVEVYDDLKIWYTYVSGRFIAETSELENIQFIIDPETYSGSWESLFDSDMVNLAVSDFTPDAKVISIRIF